MQTRSKTIKSGNKLQTSHGNSINHEAIGEIQGKTNPLYIPEIVDHIFQFLKLPDIKNCRLVCRRWNQLAENLQGKMSVVKMSDSERVEVFNKMFPNAQESRIFRRFVLGEDKDWICFGLHIQKYQLVNFINKWQQNLSEIKLFGLDFRPDLKGNPRPCYNFSPLLPSTLRKLTLQSENTTMIVSTNKLCHLEVLHLKDCTIDITPGIILNTLEIHLDCVTFAKNGEEIEEFLINPLLNFNVLKKASFNSEITLDLQGSISLDVLKLADEVKVLNWGTSQWEIKKRLVLLDFLCGIELVKSQMKYKCLKTGLDQLNVALLPEDIEKLKLNLYHDPDGETRIYGYHNFTNLKVLHLSLPLGSDFSPFVEHFKHCFNLNTLSVSLGMHYFCCTRSKASTLKTSSIPQSVKTLHVDKVRIILNQDLELESLILRDYRYLGGEYSSLAEMVRRLQVKNLFWLFGDGVVRSGGRNIFHKKTENVVKKLIRNLDNFTVGHFAQEEYPKFKKSFLFPLVDTQGKYYYFRGGDKGKAISESDAKYLEKQNMK